MQFVIEAGVLEDAVATVCTSCLNSCLIPCSLRVRSNMDVLLLRLTLLTEPGELGDEALIEEATDGGCCCWGGWEEKLKGGGC